MGHAVYTPRRYYLECLIYNRGYRTVNSFSEDFSFWAKKNKGFYVRDSLIRQYIINNGNPPMNVIMAMAQFLNAVDQIEQIHAVFIPPKVRCSGGYWTEYNPPPYRKPFLIKDLDMSTAFSVVAPDVERDSEIAKFLWEYGTPEVPTP